jgi:hypothetical protein
MMMSNMTEPRCLIEHHGGASPFQAGFVSSGKWFRRIAADRAGATEPATAELSSGFLDSWRGPERRDRAHMDVSVIDVPAVAALGVSTAGELGHTP